MNGLVNLSDIKLEEGLKGKERLQAFLIQIKAPYHYHDSEWEVTNRFTGTASLESCLVHYELTTFKHPFSCFGATRKCCCISPIKNRM